MALRPQINITRTIETTLASPEEQKIAVMLGTASWGEVKEITSISRMSKFLQNFGTNKDSVNGADNAELFFRNGSGLSFIRVTDGNEEKASVTLTSSDTDVIELKGYYPGTYGNNISVEIISLDDNVGAIISDGVFTENINNNGQGFSTNEELVSAINDTSRLVTAEVLEGHEESDLVDTTSETFLEGGSNGVDDIEDSTYTDLIENKLETYDFNYLLIPGKTSDDFHQSIISILERWEDNNKFVRYISGVDKEESLDDILDRSASSYRFTRVAPNVVIDDEVYDGSYLASAYTGVLCSLDEGFSATNNQISVEDLYVNDDRKSYSEQNQNRLLENYTVPIAKRYGQYRIIRAVTTYDDVTSPLFEEVIIDNIDTTSRELVELLQSKIGEPNTEERHDIYTSQVDSILSNLVDRGILEEFGEIIIEFGESPDSMDVEIPVKPTYALNYVNLELKI